MVLSTLEGRETQPCSAHIVTRRLASTAKNRYKRISQLHFFNEKRTMSNAFLSTHKLKGKTKLIFFPAY